MPLNIETKPNQISQICPVVIPCGVMTKVQFYILYRGKEEIHSEIELIIY